MAFWVFLAFYVMCALITWFAYVRRPTKAPEPQAAPAVEAAANA
jgi:NNP family nitrate/nitrite transporter-like MFS transporter